MRKKSKKEQKLNENPWLTKGKLKSSKTKNKLYISSLKGNSNDVQIYKKFRNKLAHVKEQSKRNYYRKLIIESQHNTKLLWTTINDIAMYKRQSNTHINYLINTTGEKVTDQSKIRNLLNSHFSEKGKKLAADIEDPESPCNFSCTSFIAQQCASFYLIKTNYNYRSIKSYQIT